MATLQKQYFMEEDEEEDYVDTQYQNELYYYTRVAAVLANMPIIVSIIFKLEVVF